MVKVEEGLFANKYETTNAEYRVFTKWAKENRPELVEEVRVKEENWGEFVSSKYQEHYSLHLAFNQYPVVNISYKGATAFCQWLTDKYNSDPKKKYEKVKIPTTY